MGTHPLIVCSSYFTSALKLHLHLCLTNHQKGVPYLLAPSVPRICPCIPCAQTDENWAHHVWPIRKRCVLDIWQDYRVVITGREQYFDQSFSTYVYFLRIKTTFGTPYEPYEPHERHHPESRRERSNLFLKQAEFNEKVDLAKRRENNPLILTSSHLIGWWKQ